MADGPAELDARLADESADLAARLGKLRTKIEAIMKSGEAQGLSLGVLHHGRVLRCMSFGYLDDTETYEIDANTILPGGSLTKAMTAAIIGRIIDDPTINRCSKLEWHTFVQDVLPDFGTRNSKATKDSQNRNGPRTRNYSKDRTDSEDSKDAIDNRNNQMLEQITVADLLSHRSGMSLCDSLFYGRNNSVLIPVEKRTGFINSQTFQFLCRDQFIYNNVAYEVAGHIIERCTGLSLRKAFKQFLLGPLSLGRTFLTPPPSTVNNVALCCRNLDDGGFRGVFNASTDNDPDWAASGSIRTSVNDLLHFYKVFLSSLHDQLKSQGTQTPESPLRCVPALVSAKIPMDETSLLEKSYAFGWARVQLPGPMGAIGINAAIDPKKMPTVAKNTASKLVLYHQGNLPGVPASAILIPDSNSAIVCLTDSPAKVDVPDLVGQLVLEEVLGVPDSDRNNYVRVAETYASVALDSYNELREAIENKRSKWTWKRDLSDYEGTYRHESSNFEIVVEIKVSKGKERLYWLLQGRESERYELTHYQYSTFTWLQPFDDLIPRGRWVG